MKTMKYLVAGLLLAGMAVPAMAQTSKAEIDAITKVIVDAKGDVVATKAQVKEYTKLHKKDCNAMVALGRAFMTAKNYEQAELLANQAIKIDKKSAEPYILLGDIASAQDDGGKAAGYYEQGTFYDPTNPTSYVKYARVYQKVDPKGAVAMLEKLRSVKPDYPVDAAAGFMYAYNGQLKSAMSYYDKVQNVASMDDYILMDYATTAYVLEEYDKAVRLCDEGLKAYPHYTSFNRVGLYSNDKLKNYDAAVAYGQRLFNTSDTIKYTVNDYVFYGDALTNLGRYDDAVASYKHITEVAPDNKDTNKYIADTYTKAGKFDEAIAAYKLYLADLGDAATYKEYEAEADIYLAQSEATTDAAAKSAALVKAADVYGEMVAKFDYAAVYGLSKQAAFLHASNPDVKAGAALEAYKKLAEKIESQAEKSEKDLSKLATAYTYVAVHYIQNDNKADAKAWAAKLLQIRPDDPNATQIMNIK